jgi:peptidyl-prolyl cis-trans isomerase A (cyclophilin A)
MRALVRPIVTAALLASVALLAPRASGQDKAPPTAPPSQPAPAAPKATPKLDDKPASPKAAPATPPATAPATPPAATPPVASGAAVEYVKMSTSMGDVIIELNREKAPLSVENFLSYVDKDYYAGTIFHRVIKTFMIQGGGFTADLTQKSTDKPIKNEWQNGLKNVRGTVAMARTQEPDSATSQFFINVVDNAYLDTPRGGAAYAVFGRVVAGMEVVDQIKAVPTAKKQATTPAGKAMFSDVPVQPVTITKMSRLSADEAKKLIK